MAKQFHFSGASDDTFGELNTDIDQGDCAAGTVMSFIVERRNGEGVKVTGQYLNTATWHIGVSALDEEKPLTSEWRFETYPSYEGYRILLIVTAPDDAELSAELEEEAA